MEQTDIGPDYAIVIEPQFDCAFPFSLSRPHLLHRIEQVLQQIAVAAFVLPFPF